MLVYLTINLAVFRRASRAVPCEHQFLLAVPCRARLGFRRLLPTLDQIARISSLVKGSGCLLPPAEFSSKTFNFYQVLIFALNLNIF